MYVVVMGLNYHGTIAFVVRIAQCWSASLQPHTVRCEPSIPVLKVIENVKNEKKCEIRS